MNNLKTGLSIVGAAIAGFTTAYLTAPRSGKETRGKLKDEFDATKEALETAAQAQLNEAKELLNKTVEDNAETGKKAIDKVKEKIIVE